MQIGRYTLDENGYSIHGKLIRDPFKMLPSECPNSVECQKCEQQISKETNRPTSKEYRH